MSVDVSTAIVIDRPVADVAAFASNPDNVPQWYANIESIEWITPPPMTVGSRLAFVANFLSRHLAYTYQVVEWTPGVRLVMRTSAGPFPMETSYVWEAVADNRTRMVLRNRGVPSGFAAWAAPLMTIAIRRANRKDLARLKARLERRGDG